MELVIREMDLERDAEGIARMFNESDLAWPGTFIEGQPMTAEMIRDWHTDSAFVAVYLAVVDGEIAGYASFEGEPDQGYLDLLNVNPRFHGLSIGRKLVQTCVNRAIQEGHKRHTLGTWSNNLKAVPVYKKTAHFWRPETSVWMQNYVPGVVQMPICKPFFERYDWYDTYVPTVTQHEDDYRWEGLKVYPMRWQANGESLAVWIDREAQAPVAVDTDDLFVAAIPRGIEALHGDEVTINWRITNKTDTMQRFLVDARGADGLEIDHREMFVVQAGATVEHVATVKVTDQAPFAKDNGDAPAVRSVITFGHDDVELFSGIRARKPIEISTDTPELSVGPGQPRTIGLQLQNRRAETAGGILRLYGEGLKLSWQERKVEIPAEGFLSIPVELTTNDERVYTLEARLTVTGCDTPLIETLQVFSVGAGGLVSQAQRKSARIETDGLRVTVAAKRGEVTLTDKQTRNKLASFGPAMGPPFYHSEAQRREFSIALEQTAGRAIVRLSAESKAQPGLVLCQRVSIAPTGLVEATAWIENRGDLKREGTVRLSLDEGERDLLTTVVPLPEGIVTASAGWWPRLHGDIPRDPAAYAEPWQAWQGRGLAAGVAWQSGVCDIRPGHSGMYLRGAVEDLAAGECSTPLTVALYGHQGEWPDVRSRLLRWAEAPRQQLRVRAVAQATIEPGLLLTESDQVETTVRASSMLNRAFDGRIRLSCEPALRVDRDEWRAPGLIQGQGAEHSIQLTLPAQRVGVYGGEVELALPMLHTRTPFHVARLGLGGSVRVRSVRDRGHDVWQIENGTSQVKVSADYGPSAYSWLLDGEEQLASFYPETRGLAWVHPFYGGIFPVLLPKDSWCSEGFLHQAPRTAAPIETTDGWGLRWTGVRLTVEPAQEQLRDLLVEFDVTTLGHSPVLKMAYRLINRRAIARECLIGLNAMPSLGGAVEDLVLVSADDWHHDTLVGSSRWGQRWAAVVNPHSARAALLVSNRNAVGLWATAQVGRLFSSMYEVRLAANETHETSFYLALADNLDEARRYIVLQNA